MIDRMPRGTGHLAVGLLLALAACTADSDASPSGAAPAVSAPAATEEQVVIQDNSFSTEELTVVPGTTVTWTNEDEQGHTVSHGEEGVPAADAEFDEPISAGQVVTYTFDEAGTFPVTCKIHPEMQMTVVVEAP